MPVIRLRRLALGVAIASLACGPAPPALSARLAVGPDQLLKLPSAAAKIAKDGDTIAIDPGTYFDCAIWSADHLTISGTGAVVITDKTCQGKALFIIHGNDATVQHITFTRARVADGNGAGIRFEGRNLIVEDSRFINNQGGILTGDNLDSVITISNSEFVDNGACQSGCAHALGIGRIGLLRITNSRFSGTKLAHDISSAARRNELIGNIIEDGPDGTSSYLVDVPIGGMLLLDHNLLEKGPRSSNSRVAIMVGGGAAFRPTGQVVAIGNRLTNNTVGAVTFIVNWSNAAPVFEKNEFVGDVTPVSTSGAWVHWARVAIGEIKAELRRLAAAVVHAIRAALARIGVL